MNQYYFDVLLLVASYFLHDRLQNLAGFNSVDLRGYFLACTKCDHVIQV